MPRVRDGDDAQAAALATRQLDRLEVDKRLLWEVLPPEDLAASPPQLDNVAGVDEGHRAVAVLGVDLQRALQVGAALVAPELSSSLLQYEAAPLDHRRRRLLGDALRILLFDRRAAPPLAALPPC